MTICTRFITSCNPCRNKYNAFKSLKSEDKILICTVTALVTLITLPFFFGILGVLTFRNLVKKFSAVKLSRNPIESKPLFQSSVGINLSKSPLIIEAKVLSKKRIENKKVEPPQLNSLIVPTVAQDPSVVIEHNPAQKNLGIEGQHAPENSNTQSNPPRVEIRETDCRSALEESQETLFLTNVNERDELSIFSAIVNNNIEGVRQLINQGIDFNKSDERNYLPIHLAAELGRLEILKILLPKTGNINAQPTPGKTALYLAVKKGHKKCTEFLLANGANANIQPPKKCSILQVVVKRGDLDWIKLITPKINDINLKDRRGRTALYMAVENEKIDIVKYLLDKGAQTNISDWRKSSVIHEAVQRKNLELLQLLLNCSEDIDTKDRDGITPLMLAVSTRDNVECINCLLAKGANINITCNEGNLALHHAAMSRSLENLIAIVQQTSNLDVRGNFCNTALHYAVDANFIEGVKFLLGKMANPNIPNNTGCLPLHHAAKIYYRPGKKIFGPEMISILKTKTLNINAQNVSNETPLYLASACNNENEVLRLLSLGADKTISNQIGKTPLDIAREKNFENLVSLLEDTSNAQDVNTSLESRRRDASIFFAITDNDIQKVKDLISQGVDLTIPDEKKYLPLHWAAQLGHLEILKILEEKTTDINAQLIPGVTALYLALKSGKKSCVEFLLSKGANANIHPANKSPILHEVVKRRNLEWIELLASKVDDINAKDREDRSVLHLAIERGDVDIAKFLLNKGASASIRDDFGQLPIHLVVGNFELLKLFIPLIENIDVMSNSEKTALMYAVSKRDNVLNINYLLSQGANPNLICRNRQVLHYAVLSRSLENLIAIANKTSDLNAKDQLGETALHLAIKENFIEGVQFLLNRQANPNIVDDKGFLPIHRAGLSIYCAELINLLGAKTTDINAKNESDDTPLHLATLSKDETAVRNLLALGADRTIVNNEGKTPLDIAIENRSYRNTDELIQILRG